MKVRKPFIAFELNKERKEIIDYSSMTLMSYLEMTKPIEILVEFNV